MTFQYNFTPNKKISDIFNSLKPVNPPSYTMAPGAVPFAPVTRTLPNNSGTYQSPVVAQPTVPVAPKIAPVVQPPTPPAPPALDYSKYTDPVTGQVLSPQQYADMVAKRAVGGSVPNYAGDALTQGPQTTKQLQSTATDLNNQRNDIATGTADPYKAGSKSGIAYSPTDLAAIEKAYAGIYDPALKDVFNKLDAKEKEDAASRENKNKLEQMAQQHKYDLELKKTSSGDSSTTPGTNSSVYVEGADPNVDSWVQRISRNEAKLSDITGVKNQGLKNLVNQGLNSQKARTAASSGNLNDINTINTLLTNPQLDNISGPIDQYTGGVFSQAKTAKVDYDQIYGAIQLAKAGQIKGQGAVSDFERTVLRQASGAIDRGQSDEEFKKALIKLRGVLMTASGLEAPIRVTSPTGEKIESTGDTEEVNELIKEGNIVEYIQ